jgi:hypothetical protein
MVDEHLPLHHCPAAVQFLMVRFWCGSLVKSRGGISAANAFCLMRYRVLDMEWKYARDMACPEGLEPPTYGLEGHCSIQLS